VRSQIRSPIDVADWRDMVITGSAAIPARSVVILSSRWIKDHCEFGNRSADGLMRIVRRWPEIEERLGSKTQCIAHLTRSGILKKLSNAETGPGPVACPATFNAIDHVGPVASAIGADLPTEAQVRHVSGSPGSSTAVAQRWRPVSDG
jgi:hypothetical protein